MTALAAQLMPRFWQCGTHRLPLNRPLVMGILNVTPDSFSDGGAHTTTDAAMAHGLALLEQGADIIDIGGESTRPGAAPVTLAEEKRRVLPLVKHLAAAGAVVSVDTMKPALMRAALDVGAAIINDVNGFRAAGALAAVAASDCGVVVMHMRGQPRTMQAAPAYGNVVSEVRRFLRTRTAALRRAGVAGERLCVDPGIGFGKTQVHNRMLLAHLPQVADGLPLLLGISRKSLFAAADPAARAAERDVMSAVAGALLLSRGVHILRVHNVAMTRQAIATWQLLSGQ